MCRPEVDTWPQIRDLLRIKFGDLIDRVTLMHDFSCMLINKNESITDFINRINIVKSRLQVKIRSDKTLTAKLKDLYVKQTDNTGLEILLGNTHGELQTILIARNPQTLENATSIVLQNVHLTQRLNHSLQKILIKLKSRHSTK